MTEKNKIKELRARWEKEESSKVFAQLAEELRKAGEREEAILVLKQGLEKHPNYVTARVILGKTLFEANNLGEARTELERALSLSPSNLAANRLLGDIYFKQSEWVRASERFRIAVELNPFDAELEDLIAQCEGAAENSPVDKTQKLNYEPSTVEVNVADIMSALSETDKEESGKFLELDIPTEERDEEPEQKQEREQAPEEQRADDITSETLAELYANQGIYDKAIRIYEKLLLQNPQNAYYIDRIKNLTNEASSADSASRELAAEPRERPFGTTREKLRADLEALHDDKRLQKLNTLKTWLSAIEREKRRA